MMDQQERLDAALHAVPDPPGITHEHIKDRLKICLPDAIGMGYYCSGEWIDDNHYGLEFAGHGPTFEVRIEIE